jgi:hypothetical protein
VTAPHRALLVAVVTALALALATTPAGAQDAPVDGPADAPDVALGVTISFDVGPYDPELGDFRVEAVEVAGEAHGPQAVTVELRDADGDVLWSTVTTLTPPSTTLTVDRPVAVGAVASAGLSQPVPVVEAAQVVPEVNHTTEGGGGSGQLALSMVVIIALVALVFRTPLPSASTARWTR